MRIHFSVACDVGGLRGIIHVFGVTSANNRSANVEKHRNTTQLFDGVAAVRRSIYTYKHTHTTHASHQSGTETENGGAFSYRVPCGRAPSCRRSASRVPYSSRNCTNRTSPSSSAQPSYKSTSPWPPFFYRESTTVNASRLRQHQSQQTKQQQQTDARSIPEVRQWRARAWRRRASDRRCCRTPRRTS
jgi:hypothetical protein